MHIAYALLLGFSKTGTYRKELGSLYCRRWGLVFIHVLVKTIEIGMDPFAPQESPRNVYRRLFARAHAIIVGTFHAHK